MHHFVGYYSYLNLSKLRTSKYKMDDRGRFPCEKCGNTYKQKTHLIRHLNFECGIEPKFVCFCGKKFKQKSNYNTHFRTVHQYNMFGTI